MRFLFYDLAQSSLLVGRDGEGLLFLTIMQTQDILQTIVARKRQELASQMEAIPLAGLEARIDTPAPGRSMRQSLAASATGIIAEFKRRSPSKGWIKAEADAARIPAFYEHAGAAALSILTDEPFFGGRLADVLEARPTVSLPILRKDFVISPYQLYQAKLAGADAVLLIAAVLTVRQCRELASLAHELRLETLLEIHDERELDYLNDNIDLLGVNNRCLGTFHTDVECSFRLAARLPADRLLVSESGISRPDTVLRLREAGFRGFLIGENFMKTPDPGQALSRFIQDLQP